MNHQLEQFDIRKFTDRLTPKKGKHRYICPVCEGTLTIEEKSGKYNCWGADCAKSDIREAIRPLEEALRDAGITDNYIPAPRKTPQPKPQPLPASIPRGEITLATLPQPVTPPARIQKGRNIEIIYPYSPTQWVLRIEKPDGSKITLPKHIDEKGDIVTGKGNELWLPYRFDEIQLHAKGKWILGVEGEKCVDATRFHLELLSFTFQGGSWSEEQLEKYFQLLTDVGTAGVIYWADHDPTGYAKAEKCFQAAAKVGLPFIVINPTRLWAECPEGGDIADWIKEKKLTQQEFLNLLHQEIQLAADEARPDFHPTICFILAFWNSFVESNNHLLTNTQVDKSSPELQTWRRCRSFTANLVINTQHFSMPLPEPGTILFINSGTGTGKTHWLINTLIKKYSDSGFLSLGYRNSLLLQFCAQLDHWYHLQQDLKGNEDSVLIGDVNSKIAACLDSLLFFHPQDFNNRILILDEIESIIYHLFYSNTNIAKYRDKIIALFIEALNRASLVICLDGHVSDITVNFIQGLITTPKTVVKVQNLYQGNKGKVKFLTGVHQDGKIRPNDYSSMIHSIKHHPGNFAIVSDSQRQIEALDKILTKQGRRTLRLDSTTSHQPWVKQFLANPAKYIRDHQIEILMYSPSSDAGLNIDIKGYFSNIYAIFVGVITTKAQLQMIARIRDPEAMLYIFCPTLGLSSGRIHKSASCPEQLAKLITEYVIECGEASLAGLPQEELAIEMVKKLVTNSANPLFKHECDLAWLEEFERHHLRACLKESLIDSGYEVEDVIGEKSCLKQLKQTVQEVLTDKAEVIANAETITDSEVQRISGNIAATPEDKAKVIKFRLQERLPGIEFATYPVIIETQTEDGIIQETIDKPVFDSGFVKTVIYDSPLLIYQMETRFLVKNPDLAKELQQIKWHQKLDAFTNPERSDHEKTMDLHSYKSQWLKVQALLDMGIAHFLQPGAQWSAESPEVINFYQQGKTRYKHTGLTVGKSKPCEFVGRALKSLGIQTQSSFNRRTRTYEVKEDSPIYTAIYESVSRRICNRLADIKPTLNWEAILISAKTPETQLEQGTQAAHLPLNCYINIAEGVTMKPMPEIDLVAGSREFIREALADNLLDWGGLQTYFANIHGDVKQAVWSQLTGIEQEQLKKLQPTNKAEEFAKLLLEGIKFNRDTESLEALFRDANQLLAILDAEQQRIFIDCLPRKYHNRIVIEV